MLVELRLRNFRCFKDHTLSFKPVTVLVGGNNAGKSTVVEALRLLALVISRYGSVNFKDVPGWLAIPKGLRGFAPSTQGIEWNVISVFHNLGKPPSLITATFDSGASVDLYVGPEGALHAVIKDTEGKPITTKGYAKLVDLPSVSILPQVAPVAKEEDILTPVYAKSVISSSWASLHFRNQINLHFEYFPEFKELAESTWPNLRILPLEGQGGLPGQQLALFIQDGSFVAEIAWMGMIDPVVKTTGRPK